MKCVKSSLQSTSGCVPDMHEMKTIGIFSHQAVTLSTATAVLVETFLFIVGLPVKVRPLSGYWT